MVKINFKLSFVIASFIFFYSFSNPPVQKQNDQESVASQDSQVSNQSQSSQISDAPAQSLSFTERYITDDQELLMKIINKISELNKKIETLKNSMDSTEAEKAAEIQGLQEKLRKIKEDLEKIEPIEMNIPNNLFDKINQLINQIAEEYKKLKKQLLEEDEKFINWREKTLKEGQDQINIVKTDYEKIITSLKNKLIESENVTEEILKSFDQKAKDEKEAAEIIQGLIGQIIDLNQQLENVSLQEIDISQLEDKIERIKSEKNSYLELIAEQRLENDKLQKSTETLEEDFNNLNLQHQALIEQNQNLSNQIQTIQQEASEKSSQVANFETQIKEMESQFSTILNSVLDENEAKLASQIEKHEKEKLELSSQISDAQNSLSQTVREKTDLENKQRVLIKQFGQNAKEIAQIALQIEQVKNLFPDFDESNQLVDEIRNQIQILQDSKSSEPEKETQINQLQEQLLAAEKAKANIDQKLELAQIENSELQQRLALESQSLKERLQIFQTEYENLSQLLKQENNQLKDDLVLKTEESAKLEQEISRLKLIEEKFELIQGQTTQNEYVKKLEDRINELESKKNEEAQRKLELELLKEQLRREMLEKQTMQAQLSSAQKSFDLARKEQSSKIPSEQNTANIINISSGQPTSTRQNYPQNSKIISQNRQGLTGQRLNQYSRPQSYPAQSLNQTSRQYPGITPVPPVIPLSSQSSTQPSRRPQNISTSPYGQQSYKPTSNQYSQTNSNYQTVAANQIKLNWERLRSLEKGIEEQNKILTRLEQRLQG